MGERPRKTEDELRRSLPPSLNYHRLREKSKRSARSSEESKEIVYALTWRKKDLEDVGILATVAEVTEEMELDEQFGTGDLTLVFDSPRAHPSLLH